MWLQGRRSRPQADPVPKAGQAGYLWGQGEQIMQVGESDSWHWRAEPGHTIAKWELFYGGRKIGMEVYPTHQAKDWPDLLFQMLLGLKGLAEIPMDDDEVDEIIAHAEDCARRTMGFPWMSKHSKNPHPKGTPQAELWAYTYRCAYKRTHGVEYKA